MSDKEQFVTLEEAFKKGYRAALRGIWLGNVPYKTERLRESWQEGHRQGSIYKSRMGVGVARGEGFPWR